MRLQRRWSLILGILVTPAVAWAVGAGKDPMPPADSAHVECCAPVADDSDESDSEELKAGFVEPDYQPIATESTKTAKPHGNLDVSTRHFAILEHVDLEQNAVSLLIEGDAEPKQWPLRPGAELWCFGTWARLDHFTAGDRVWVWFEKNLAGEPARVALIADELSEQYLYAPFELKEVHAAGSNDAAMALESPRQGHPVARVLKFTNAETYRGGERTNDSSFQVGEKLFVQTTGDQARLILDAEAFRLKRDAQLETMRNRWTDEGLSGTLIFAYPDRNEVEVMLDHEGMSWGRSLREGDKVTLQAMRPVEAVVKQLQPWRERTQLLLELASSAERPELTVGQRIAVRIASAPIADGNSLPSGLGRDQEKSRRVEWLMSSIYCTCGMHDACAGHVFTLAACDAGPGHTCGLARETRKMIAERIDQGQADEQIFESLVRERGPNVVRPHMLP